jgi:hypothetical protein
MHCTGADRILLHHSLGDVAASADNGELVISPVLL